MLLPPPCHATAPRYPDYELTQSGLQYKDMRDGAGTATAREGDNVVIDWDGYTIGYYGECWASSTVTLKCCEVWGVTYCTPRCCGV